MTLPKWEPSKTKFMGPVEEACMKCDIREAAVAVVNDSRLELLPTQYVVPRETLNKLRKALGD